MEQTNQSEATTSLDKIHTLIENATDYVQKMHCDTCSWTRPFKCAVPSCSNAFHKFDPSYKLPYKFHNFPEKKLLKAAWMRKCSIYEQDTLYTKVCSDHFNLDDYDRNYKEEFKNPSYKRKLKPDAVPSKNLDGEPVTVNLDINDDLIYPTSADKDVDKSMPTIEVVRNLFEENGQLKEKYEKLQAERSEFAVKVQSYDRKLRTRKRDIVTIRNLYEKLRKSSLTINEQKNLLLKVFSDAQINVLLGKKKVIWSQDDLAMAFTLRHMSSRECYLYLKRTLNMPLPALSCVQKWAASK